MREAIKGYSGEVFDLFCGNDLLWDSHNCKKVTKNLPVDAKSKKPLSVLPIVLDMMERFWAIVLSCRSKETQIDDPLLIRQQLCMLINAD